MTSQYQRIIKFIMSGGTAAIIEYSLFSLIVILDYGSLVTANVVSFTAGLAVSFYLNRTWVFKNKSHFRLQVSLYFLLALFNLVFTSVTISVLVNDLNMLPYIAKFITMGIIAAWNYIIFMKVIFKKRI